MKRTLSTIAIATLCIFSVAVASDSGKASSGKGKSTSTNKAASPKSNSGTGGGIQTYNLKAGDEYTYNVRVASNQNINMMGQESETKTVNTTRIHVKVKDATANAYTITTKSDTATLDMKMNGMMGAKDTVMKMGEIAAITNVYNLDKTGKILSQSTEGGDAAAKTAQAMMRQFTGSGKGDFHFIEFPEAALTKGYTWSKTTSDTNRMGNNGEGGNIITVSTTRYTYDGTVDTLGFKCGRILTKSEKLNVSGVIKQPGPGGVMMDIEMEGDGVAKGVHYLELSTGMPVASLGDTQMDTRMTVSGQMQMVMPVSADMKISYVRAKKK